MKVAELNTLNWNTDSLLPGGDVQLNGSQALWAEVLCCC